MSKRNEDPERINEAHKSDEFINNPAGNVNIAFNRAGNGNLVELVGSVDWKITGIVFLIITIGLFVATFYLL